MLEWSGFIEWSSRVISQPVFSGLSYGVGTASDGSHRSNIPLVALADRSRPRASIPGEIVVPSWGFDYHANETVA